MPRKAAKAKSLSPVVSAHSDVWNSICQHLNGRDVLNLTKAIPPLKRKLSKENVEKWEEGHFPYIRRIVDGELFVKEHPNTNITLKFFFENINSFPPTMPLKKFMRQFLALTLMSHQQTALDNAYSHLDKYCSLFQEGDILQIGNRHYFIFSVGKEFYVYLWSIGKHWPNISYLPNVAYPFVKRHNINTKEKLDKFYGIYNFFGITLPDGNLKYFYTKPDNLKIIII
jgi:hypothetical protein